MMYYLFITKERDKINYMWEFNRVANAMKEGKTPVYNEMRSAKIQIIESIPFNVLNGIFIVLGTLLIQSFGISELVSIGIMLIMNCFAGALANYIFTVIKHHLRIKLCARLGIEPTEFNIGVMESLEYQTVGE